MMQKLQVGRFLHAEPGGPVQTVLGAPGSLEPMKKSASERPGAAWRASEVRPPHLDHDASADLARVLGGIGTPPESHALAARLAAAIEDLGSNAWV